MDGEDPGGSSHQSDVLALQCMNGFKEKEEHFGIQHSVKGLENSVNDAKPNN